MAAPKSFQSFYQPRFEHYFRQISSAEQARNPGKKAKQSTSKTAQRQKTLAQILSMRAAAGKDLYADIGTPTNEHSEADLIRGAIGYKDPLQSSIESLRKKRASQLAKSGELDKYVGQRSAHGVNGLKHAAIEDSALQMALDKKRSSFKDSKDQDGNVTKSAQTKMREYIAEQRKPFEGKVATAASAPKTAKAKNKYAPREVDNDAVRRVADAIKSKKKPSRDDVQLAINAADAAGQHSLVTQLSTIYGGYYPDKGSKKPFTAGKQSASIPLQVATEGVLKAVNALDTGRAAVQAGITEASQAGLFGPMNKQRDTGISSDPSFSEFVKETLDPKERITGGELIQNSGAPDFISKNRAVQTVGGIALDAATDPLTYVGGYGIAKRGAEEVALHAAEAGSEAVARTAARRSLELAGKEVTDSAVEALIKKVGPAELLTKFADDPEVASHLGDVANMVQRARRANIAGLTDEEIAQYLPEGTRRGLGVGIGEAKIPIPGTNSVTARNFSRALHEGAAGTADKILNNAFTRAFIPKAALKSAARNGTAQEAFGHALGQATARAEKAFARSTAEKFTTKFGKALSQFTDEEKPLVMAAREGDTEARKLLGSRMAPIDDLFEEIHAAAREAGLPIGKTEDYFPHLINTDPKIKAALEKLGVKFDQNGKGFGRAFEQGRSLKPGKNLKFMGETFDARNNAAITRKVYRIFRKKVAEIDPKLADELAGFFDPDVSRVMDTYIRSVSKRMGQARFAQKLADKGVGGVTNEVFDVLADPKAARALGRQFAGHANEADLLADRVALNAEDLGSRLAGATGEALPDPRLARAATEAETATSEALKTKRWATARARRMIAQNDRAAVKAAEMGGSIAAKHAQLEAEAVQLAQQLDSLHNLFGDKGLQGAAGKALQAKSKIVENDLASLARAKQSWLDKIDRLSQREIAHSERLDSAWDAVHSTQEQLDGARAAVERSVEENTQYIDSLQSHLEDVLANYDSVDPAGRAHIDEWISAVEEQINYAQALNVEEDPTLRTVLGLSQQAADLRGQLASTAAKLGDEVQQLSNLPTVQVSKMRKMFADNIEKYSELKQGLSTPSDVADWILETENLNWPDFMRGFDRLVAWQKSWQIATPGFHTRNFMGGAFNNALAGVKPRAYAELRQAVKDEAKWLEKGGIREAMPENVARLQSIREIVGKGQIGDAFLDVLNADTKVRARDFVLPTTHNVWVRGNRNVGEHVEFVLRGALAWDRMSAGHSIESAANAIAKYHFDYDELSSLEKGIRHFMPFYTWTRKNVPLQLEMMVRNPKWYARYAQVKNEVERTSEEDPILPDYFNEDMDIRTPWQKGGGHVYAAPDLPLNDVNRVTSVAALADTSLPLGERIQQATEDPLSMITPTVKAPIELMEGKQVFANLPLDDSQPVPVPLPAVLVSGLAPALQAAGIASRNNDGDLVMSQSHAYLLEQYVPIIAQYRRLFPKEDKYEARHMSTLLSRLGFRVATNTAEEQATTQYFNEQDAQKAADRKTSLAETPEMQDLRAEIAKQRSKKK